LSKAEKTWGNTILLILPSVLILIFSSDLSFSMLEGILLLIPLPVFLFMMSKQETEEKFEDLSNVNLVKSSFWIFIGGAGLYFGSNFAIKGSLELVEIFGLSKGFAGAVILAAGTGLPELVTTIVAGFKREMSLAFANIVGSNALNAFAVLGLSALIYPFDIPSNMAYFNAPILVGISFFGMVPLMFFSNKVFFKTWSVLLFASYVTFTYVSF
jgi:cation:H+ antiporter